MKKKWRMVKRGLRIQAGSALVLSLMILSLHGCFDRSSKGTVVAKVGDEVLTLEEIDVLTSQGKTAPVTFDERREFIQQWIDTEVLYRAALREKLHKDPQIRGAIRQMEKELLASELMQRRLGTEMAIADREIEEYYQNAKDDYTLKKPMRRARHILLESREQAIDVRGRLLRGEPFASLVVEMSLDTTTHATGGDLGLFSRQDVSPEIANAAFSLEVDDISEPIRTEWGYHILQVTEIHPEGSVIPLSEVKNDIANRIYASKQRQAFDDLIKELKHREDIEVHWNLIEAEHLPDTLGQDDE